MRIFAKSPTHPRLFQLELSTEFSRVLREFRESTAETQRLNLLTIKDINNIKHAFGIGVPKRLRCKGTVDENACGEYQLSIESSDEEEEEASLRGKVLNEIEQIFGKVSSEEVQENVLTDVYELLQAASSILQSGGRIGEGEDANSNIIQTYYLTLDL